MTNHKKSKASGFIKALLYKAFLWLGLIIVVYLLLNWSFVLAYAEYYWQKQIVVQPQLHTQISPENNADSNQGQCELPKLAANHLYIPAIQVLAPIQYPASVNDSEFQLALQSGVAHYPNTALPGQVGNAYFMGHSSDWWRAPGNFKTIFALLPQLLIDDWVFVSDKDGKVYGYQVTAKFVVSPDDLWVLSQYGDVRMLTLQTSYPLGTALKRYVVQAKLSYGIK